MLPEAFTKRMKTLLAEEYGAFLDSFSRPRAVALRLNPLKTQAPPDLSGFSLRPVPWEPCGFYYDPETRPGKSAYHEAGLYYLQEASAMAPAALLDPQPGERVLDLCAAPGGKSTQLAGKMRGRGLLVCNEINPKRAKILASNIERLGIANALVLNEHPQRLEARFAGWFDKILVDAPCSGEGMFRKEEAAVTDWSEETVLMCARRQAEILHSASVMLRPGGRLVYSTCTFAPEENEASVSAFLRAHPDFSVEETFAPWFSPGRPDWISDPMPGLEKTFRLMPHRLLGEGHYCAVLRKAGDTPGSEVPLEPAAKRPKELDDFCKQTGAAGGQACPVRAERVSCAGRSSEPQGASCAACGAGARRGAQKPLWTRARLGAVAERASELRFIPGGKRRDSPLSCRRRACRRRARLDAGAGRAYKPRLGKGRRADAQKSLSKGAAALRIKGGRLHGRKKVHPDRRGRAGNCGNSEIQSQARGL